MSVLYGFHANPKLAAATEAARLFDAKTKAQRLPGPDVQAHVKEAFEHTDALLAAASPGPIIRDLQESVLRLRKAHDDAETTQLTRQLFDADGKTFAEQAPGLLDAVTAAARALPGREARAQVVDRLPGGPAKGASVKEAFEHTSALLASAGNDPAMKKVAESLRELRRALARGGSSLEMDDALVQQLFETNSKSFKEHAPELMEAVTEAARTLPGQDAHDLVASRLPGGKLQGASVREALAHTRAALASKDTAPAIRTIEEALQELRINRSGQPKEKLSMDGETKKLMHQVFSGGDGALGFAQEGASYESLASHAQALRDAVDAQTRAFPGGDARTHVIDRLPNGGATMTDALRHTHQLLETKGVAFLLDDVRNMLRRNKLTFTSLGSGDLDLLKMLLHVERNDPKLSGFSTALSEAKTGDELLRILDEHDAGLRAHFKQAVDRLLEGVPDDVRRQAQGFVSVINDGGTVSVDRAMETAHEFLKSSGSLDMKALREAIHALKGRPAKGHASGGYVQYENLDVIFRAVDEVLLAGREGKAPPCAEPFLEDNAYNIRIFKAMAYVMNNVENA